jgi:hypothetical protein
MISTLQYQEMLRRLSPKQQTGIYEPCTHEVGKGGLHERIEEYCRSKGWVYVHSRTDQRSTTALATPDFVIAADDGRTFWIECKRKGSKATPEQQGKILMLQKLGHKATIVWSYEEFLEFIK